MAIIESEQARIIALTQIVRGPFYFRYASYPKKEDIESGSGLRSEDYVVTDIEPYRALFALCDGVGASFYANIGSQFLGETLLNWLRSLTTRPEFISRTEFGTDRLGDLRQELKVEIDRRATFADSIVKSKDLSKNKQIRLAEEMQRNDFGTQSNFVCGLILPKSPNYPDGLLLFFWLGNARLRLFRKTGENYEDLTGRSGWGKDPAQLKEVWSSKEGTVGQIYVYCTNLSDVTHILAYSDGLEYVEEKILPGFKAISFKDLVEQAQSIKDDDVSFLEITAIQEDLALYADDIVSKVRSQFNLSGKQANVRELRVQLDDARRKIADLTKANASLRKRITQASALFSVIFLAFGLFIGFGLNSIGVWIPSTPTPSFTLSASDTPIVPTATYSLLSATLVPSETQTETPTVPVTAVTETGTMSPTLEPTISPTDIATMTETASVVISTVSISP